jgi:hypothetical protein
MPSTSEKLNELLEEEVRASFADPNSKKHRRRIRRQRLYGLGGGAVMPRVRGGEAQAIAAFATAARLPGAASEQSHAARPSDHHDTYEHDAWYRMSYAQCSSHTASSAPDRVYVGGGAARRRGGVGKARREPWYGGALDRSNAPSSDLFADAVRYGYDGARRRRQYQQFSGAAPAKTLDDMCPEYLRRNTSLRAEWAPALRGQAPGPGGVWGATPRLWPENASYPSGYKGASVAQRPSSSWYRNQTTIADTCTAAPGSDDQAAAWLDARVKRVAALEQRSTARLQRASKLEKASLRSALYNASIVTGGTVLTEYELRAQLDKEEDASTGRAVIARHSGPSLILTAPGLIDADPVAGADVFRFDLKWQELGRLYRDVSYDKAVKDPVRFYDELVVKLRDASSGPLIQRETFLETLAISVNGMSRGRANLLFSVFAPPGALETEYVTIMAPLRCVANDWDAQTCLEELWAAFSAADPRRSTARRVEAALAVCARSARDLADVKRVVPLMIAQLTRRVVLRADDPLDEEGGEEALAADGVFGVAPPTPQDFRAALEATPRALAVFGRQLAAARAFVTGKDDAPADSEGVPGPSVARRVTSLREDLNGRLHTMSTSMRAPTGMRS